MKISLGHIITLHQSMSASEKGYIKKYFNINPDHYKPVLAFFELIEKHLPKGAESVETDQAFLRHKENLYQYTLEIVSILEKYHSSASMEIRSILNQIEVLVEKNLYTQAEKLIRKAKKLAEKQKDLLLFSEVCEWEIAMLGQKAPDDKLIKQFDVIFDRLDKDVDEELTHLKA